jgi:hypothetical protein
MSNQVYSAPESTKYFRTPGFISLLLDGDQTIAGGGAQASLKFADPQYLPEGFVGVVNPGPILVFAERGMYSIQVSVAMEVLSAGTSLQSTLSMVLVGGFGATGSILTRSRILLPNTGVINYEYIVPIQYTGFFNAGDAIDIVLQDNATNPLDTIVALASDSRCFVTKIA